jgi:hypothetical protein
LKIRPSDLQTLTRYVALRNFSFSKSNRQWVEEGPSREDRGSEAIAIGGHGLGIAFWFVLKQRPRCWAIGEAVSAAGAFSFENFVHVMDVLHFWMDRAFGANLTAKTTGDAETLDDSDFHRLLRST